MLEHQPQLTATVALTLGVIALLVGTGAAVPSYRLPGDVRPENYTLRIVTHFQDDEFRFYGQVFVDVRVIRDTDKVRLHAKALNVDYRSVSLTPLAVESERDRDVAEAAGIASTTPTTDASEENNNIPESGAHRGRELWPPRPGPGPGPGGAWRSPPQSGHYVHAASEASFRGLDITDVSLDQVLDELIVSTSSPLTAGSLFRLSLRYWGTLNEDDRGYYRGSYQYKNETRWIASTVFEPDGARRAFPCFDEPHLKANFTLILGRHRNFTSRANMPMEYSEPMDGRPDWFWDHYPPTPKMSTYLVAFMIHVLESKSSNPSNQSERAGERPVLVWAPPERVQFSNFSLWVAPRVLRSLGDILGAPAVLPKQDLVAVPGFRSEALENWGLVSFEERHLLLPPDAGQLAKQSVGSVVAHELAHIWFGNLLTPSWWSDIWLSEGFATYYSAVALDREFPSWRVHETSAGNALLLVTSVDANPQSQPLLHPADNPHKLSSVFSAISYYKGYWMLRMLNNTLGRRVFDEGIQLYVRRNLYGSVSSEDLWTALQEVLDSNEVPRKPLTAAEDLATVSSIERVTANSENTSLEPHDDTTMAIDLGDQTTITGPLPTESVVAGKSSVNRMGRDIGMVPIALLVEGSQLPAIASLQEGLMEGADDGEDIRDEEDRHHPVIATPGSWQTEAEGDESHDAVESDPNTEELGDTKQGTYLFEPGNVRLPRSLSEIMRNWLERPGYPIITVHRNSNSGVVTVNQRRYTSPRHTPPSSNSTWWIPLVYTTGRSSVSSIGEPSLLWLPPTSANVTLPTKVPRDTWIMLNVGAIGLCRVQYDERTMQQLSRLPRAAWQVLPPLTRVQLVADALTLAKEGRAHYSPTLDIVSQLRRETSPMVWRAALPQLLYIERQLRGRQESLALRAWLLDLLGPHAGSIGFSVSPQDSPPQASLRQEVTALACRADHVLCSRKARKVLQQMMSGRQQAFAAGPLTKPMLCSAVRWGSHHEWRFMRSYVSQLSGPNKRAAIAALACSRDSETLRSLLADAVSPNSTFRASDVATVVSSVSENEFGTDLTIRFIEENAIRLYHRLGGSPFRVEKMLREVSSSLNTAKQLERLEASLRHLRSLSPLRTTPTWGRETVRENMNWVERSRADVARWLRARLDEDDEEYEYDVFRDVPSSER